MGASKGKFTKPTHVQQARYSTKARRILPYSVCHSRGIVLAGKGKAEEGVDTGM